jgi:cell division septum initiation protein DivIVA
MDLGSILGLIAGIGVPTIGGILACGKLLQMVKDHERELEELRKDVDQAQDSALKVSGLAAAVEHMGERFADQIRHLVDTMSLNNEHVKTQLADIKAELKSVRSSRARSQ